MPVDSLTSWKVTPASPAKRSKALISRKENERAPFLTARDISSRGTPARSRLWIQRALAHITRGEEVSLAWRQDPELDQASRHNGQIDPGLPEPPPPASARSHDDRSDRGPGVGGA